MIGLKSHFLNISPQNTVKATEYGRRAGTMRVTDRFCGCVVSLHGPKFLSLWEPPGTMALA